MRNRHQSPARVLPARRVIRSRESVSVLGFRGLVDCDWRVDGDVFVFRDGGGGAPLGDLTDHDNLIAVIEESASWRASSDDVCAPWTGRLEITGGLIVLAPDLRRFDVTGSVGAGLDLSDTQVAYRPRGLAVAGRVRIGKTRATNALLPGAFTGPGAGNAVGRFFNRYAGSVLAADAHREILGFIRGCLGGSQGKR